ncbi:MAG TPA: GNAT family N-acetyltransferase [Clostridia bacterium]|nr:GNAT family N-acetyltransferase [Clostridia bacterium]
MTKIRQYKQTDKANLQNICVETTLFPKTEKVRKWLPIAYNDYYTEKQSEYVFVCADDSDKAVGYVLCAPDEKPFLESMFSEYLPKIKKISFLAYALLKREFSIIDKHYENYPAHLHIDILPDFQRMGMGRKLIDALMQKLRENKIRGVKLSCSVKNKNAIAFYRKYGFSELGKQGGCVIFGYDLGE